MESASPDEQRFQLAPRHVGLEPLERRFGVAHHRLVFLGFAELDHGDLVVELPLDAADGGELVLERGALLHHALGALRVVPEIRVFGFPVQLLQAPGCLVDVKDASSAARPTA